MARFQKGSRGVVYLHLKSACLHEKEGKEPTTPTGNPRFIIPRQRTPALRPFLNRRHLPFLDQPHTRHSFRDEYILLFRGFGVEPCAGKVVRPCVRGVGVVSASGCAARRGAVGVFGVVICRGEDCIESNVASKSLPASELALEHPGTTLEDDAALPERAVARIGGGNSCLSGCCSRGGVLLLRCTGSGAEKPCLSGEW